ncbi:4-phosphopantetheinyl transferase [Telluria mixta]|uniref:4-phosphopantetheinyl transferase n=1 Tax=Telluria mixta TaxID=34071 RepID=A0ABT2BSG9_9BURK|nr:4-phosphopantetheinyl transferase [Telluria mixta]MCS0628063.1 4-phosphopantetheinyl transferase [Telluria mixta]WEM93821.1 4-phosphopantetheinyl transferase [Telluria mixta]
MDHALAVRWWAGGGFAEAPASDVLHIVGVCGQPDRATARRTIRLALLAALAEASGLPAAAIQLCGAPGEAPYALLDGHRIGLSISHDGHLSVAAFRLDAGAVGIDLMQVTDVPDWQAVARDYLGPGCAATLTGMPAFARAWSEREARLKCRGLALAEWSASDEPLLSACSCLSLVLPDGYVGSVAVLPD